MELVIVRWMDKHGNKVKIVCDNMQEAEQLLAQKELKQKEKEYRDKVRVWIIECDHMS